MPTNDFLPIATSGGAYVESQATFAADASVLANGFPSGILTKEKLNKVIRQSSIMSSVLAQYIADLTGANSVDDGTITALLAGLKSTASAAGHVMFFAASTAPAGYIKANGAAISRTAYARLFAAIGTVFGAGDGSTTFALPDLRGEFLRGFDDGRGADSGRLIGSTQVDGLKSHTHQMADGWGTKGSWYGAGTFNGTTLGRVSEGDSSGIIGMTDATGITETRPRNIALLACIKY